MKTGISFDKEAAIEAAIVLLGERGLRVLRWH
jgi:hypothetical protein